MSTLFACSLLQHPGERGREALANVVALSRLELADIDVQRDARLGVAGPYTTISCTLQLLSSKIRICAASAPEYREQPPDARFQYDSVAVQSIASSTGRKDSGPFELHFEDEGYLPFEG